MDRPPSGSRLVLLAVGVWRVESDRRRHGLHGLVQGRVPRYQPASARVDHLAQLLGLATTSAGPLTLSGGVFEVRHESVPPLSRQ